VAQVGEIQVEVRKDAEGREQWTWQFAGSNGRVVASCQSVHPTKEALVEDLRVARAELAGARVVQHDPHGGVVQPEPGEQSVGDLVGEVSQR
jgi:hypothetical protein